jgi:molybdate transport system ATP-binding protein
MNNVEMKYSLQKGDFKLEVDTRIPATGITGVFGESGSGKTTLLRCIAGLEALTDEDSRPPHKRRIGYVFQDSELFPHLTVQKNLEYGWRRNPDARRPITEFASMLEVDQLLDRSVSDLSGGEAQRVCIARVLCQEPQLILMDEPLSALDARRRNNVLPYLDRLHSETSVPIIYVSHNIDEICRLSDHLILLDNGKVVAEGGLQETLARIDLPQFRGQNAGAVLEANQSRYDAEFDLSLFQFLGGELWVPGCQDTRTTRLRIDAGDISLSRTSVKSSTILNILPAVIDEMIAETASTQLVRLRLGTNFLVARITRRSLHELNLQVDDNVFAQIKSVTVRY